MSFLDKLFGRKASGDRTPGERLPFQQQLQGAYGVSGLLGVNLPGTNVNWEAQAGDLSLNSVVASCLSWVCRNFAKAPICVATLNSAGEYTVIPNHPLALLLQQPHPNYSGAMLMQMLLLDYWTRGNCYTHVVRSAHGTGTPYELHYLPARAVWPIPAPDMSSVIDAYRYYANGVYYTVPDADIIHHRFGLDPNNLLVGRNPLASALREIVTDNEASTFAAAMVLNGGIPSVLISPKPNKDGITAQIDQAKAQTMIDKWKEKTRGDNRGNPVFQGYPVDVNKLSFSPKEMATDEIRRKPEERIPSLFGISPMVLDLGAGLENSTYSNKEEAEKAAYTNCLLPLWEYFAQEWTCQLLSLYPGTPANTVVWYDTRKIPALQDDINAKSTRLVAEYVGGVAMRSDARLGLGYKVSSDDNVYAKDPNNPAVDPMLGDGAPPSGEDVPPEKGAKQRRFVDGTLGKLEAAAIKYRSALRQHEDDAVATMADAYKTIKDALVKQSADLQDLIDARDLEGGAVDETWFLQQDQYRSLIQQVLSLLATFADDMEQPLKDGQLASVNAALEHTESMATAAAGKAPTGVSLSWATLPIAQINTFIGFASNGSPLRALLDALGPDAAKSVHDSIVAGIGTGQNPNDVADTITDALDGNQARAVNIARTEMLRAARSASISNYQQNSDVVNSWTWWSSMDTDTCVACWAMQGTVHSNTEVLDGHPQCRCSPVPNTKSWAEMTGDDSVPDTRPVPPTGEEIFKGLTDDEQKTILGPALYDLYSAGTITLADTVIQTHSADWGTMRRVATVAEATAS